MPLTCKLWTVTCPTRVHYQAFRFLSSPDERILGLHAIANPRHLASIFENLSLARTRPRSCFVQKKITRMRADTWSDPPSKRASSRFNVSFLRLDAKISNFVRWGVSFFLGNFTRFTQGNNLYVKEDVVQKYFYRSREVIASLKSGSWRILEMDEFLHARVFILYLRGKKEEFEVDRNVLFLEIYRTSNLRRR